MIYLIGDYYDEYLVSMNFNGRLRCNVRVSWRYAKFAGVGMVRGAQGGEAGGGGGPRECARLEITRRISVAPAPPATPRGASAPHRTHYPLTIRNRPTSWLLDLGYNDLTSAK